MNERPEKQYRERNAREPRRQVQVEYRRGLGRTGVGNSRVGETQDDPGEIGSVIGDESGRSSVQ